MGGGSMANDSIIRACVAASGSSGTRARVTRSELPEWSNSRGESIHLGPAAVDTEDAHLGSDSSGGNNSTNSRF